MVPGAACTSPSSAKGRCVTRSSLRGWHRNNPGAGRPRLALRSARIRQRAAAMKAMNQCVLELVEIDAANWRQSLAVEVRPDQVAFVADVQPVALVILAKCYLRPEDQTWKPYLALDGGKAVGVTGVASASDRAHLRHFAIDHRRQGEGLGRLMLDEVVAAIRRSQPACSHVQVTTHPANAAALALYRSAGFRDTGDSVGIEPVLLLEILPTSPDRPKPPSRRRTR